MLTKIFAILFLFSALAQADLKFSQRSLFQSKVEVQRVADRLSLIESLLRLAPTDHLTEAQKNNRAASLDHLRNYWQAGQFPINLESKKHRVPVFIDAWQVACAVGYLVIQSGHKDLAKSISKNQNFRFLEDIQVAGLTEWVVASGFSLEELKLIQPTYGPSGEVALAIIKHDQSALDKFAKDGRIDEVLGVIVQLENVKKYSEMFDWALSQGANPTNVIKEVTGNDYFNFQDITAFELAVMVHNTHAVQKFIKAGFDTEKVPLLPLMNADYVLNKHMYAVGPVRQQISIFNLLYPTFKGNLRTQSLLRMASRSRNQNVDEKVSFFPKALELNGACTEKFVSKLESRGASITDDILYLAAKPVDICRNVDWAIRLCGANGEQSVIDRMTKFKTEQNCP